MKRLAFITGLLLLGLIWFGPLLGAWRDSFAAHMLAHMGVVAIAAPLIAIGLSSQKTSGPAKATGPELAFASMPAVASFLELVVVWGWHLPQARAVVERANLAIVLEQGSFLAVGLLLWITCLRPGREGPGAFALLLTSVHMTLLGALLSLSPRPLYGEGEVSCFGIVLDAGRDQQLGGVLMLVVGALVYLAGGLFLLGRLLGPHDARGVAR